jgi:A/G-specific adenine glycosylase
MSFITEIIKWYTVNKRDLPWRNTTDPYIIWLSEIILQQTRVEQGLPYFHRFAEKYPTVRHFASATEDEILNLWQGLGYYSRGRNMLITAQLVVEQYNGIFPNSYTDLIKLKGIGEYTAAAISSFSANEAKAVVDGNVFRVLARYLGIDEPINSTKGKKVFADVANQSIDVKFPGLSNQALMEFGALHCTPRNPLCNTCPIRPGCVAYKTNSINTLPLKLPKQKARDRYFNYLVLITGGKILLNKRGPNDIWQNLYELPLIETSIFMDASAVLNFGDIKSVLGPVEIKQVFAPVKHLLSHQRIYAQFIVINAERTTANFANRDWFYADIADLQKLAQPQLIFSFLKKILT